ncbi:MAG TPA: hypothetical protein VGE61_01610 [Glycomyces sp.]
MNSQDSTSASSVQDAKRARSSSLTRTPFPSRNAKTALTSLARVSTRTVSRPAAWASARRSSGRFLMASR